MIEIEYNVSDAGWATAKIGNGTESRLISVSYLHDTLKELAQSAIQIREKDSKTVVFMDEPGEHHLVLTLKDKDVFYELRWYKDWASWNMAHEDDFELILTGQTTLAKYVNVVRNVLINIIEEYGTVGYKEKWIKDEFPLEEYQELK